jgi:hypothetical protein
MQIKHSKKSWVGITGEEIMWNDPYVIQKAAHSH